MGPIAIATRVGIATTGIIATGLFPPAAGVFAAVAAPIALSDGRRGRASQTNRAPRPARVRGVAARRARPAASR